MDFRDRSPDADAGGTTDAFPDPTEADPVQVERYNELFLEANPDVAVRNGAAGEGRRSIRTGRATSASPSSSRTSPARVRSGTRPSVSCTDG